MLKKILLWIIYLLFVLIIVLSVGTYYLLKNKDNITVIVTNQLNAHLKVPIHTSRINVSLIKKIPYVAVEFENVWAQDALNKNDTLFSIKKAYILLNIIKIMKGEYLINKLAFQEGTINMIINQGGISNYQIWQETQNTDKNEKKYQVNLNDITLENINLNFINKPNDFHFSSHINILKLNGDISNNTASLALYSNTFINFISRGDIKYVKNGSSVINVLFNKQKQILTYKDGIIKINRQRVESAGLIDLSNGNIDVRMNGKNLRFDSDENIFNLDNKITSYARIKGNVYTIVKLSGNFRYKNKLDIYTSFNLSNGTFNLKNNSLSYNLRFVKGSFVSNRNKRDDIFRIDSIFAVGNNDTITGNFLIKSFKNPQLRFNANASIMAENMNAFIDLKDYFYFEKGKLKLNWHTDFINLNEETLWKYVFQKTKNTRVYGYNVSVNFPTVKKVLSGLNTFFYLNKSLDIKRLSCSCPDMDITLEGKISNLYNLLNKKNTWIDLRSYSDKVDLLKMFFIPQNEEDSNKIKYPQFIYLKSEMLIENLIIDDNVYNNAQTEFYYKPGLATLKLYNSDVFSGRFKGNCAVSFSELNGMKMAVIAETENVDITSLFKAYKEFGQDFITSRNLKGKIDAKVNFKSDLTDDFRIKTNSVILNADVKIRNGELVDHKPMYSLSKYIKIDELKHIYFSDLENDIFIKNQCVTIPIMTINSSAMDIEVSGRHYFNSKYEYQVNFYLSDLLAKKVSKNKENENAFTYTVRDNAKHFRLPLIMVGDSVDYDVQINKKQARKNFAESVQKEKQEIKQAFINEFKLFNKQAEDTLKNMNNQFKIDFQDTSESELKDIKTPESENANINALKFEWDD